jgi:WD40 repeat protein
VTILDVEKAEIILTHHGPAYPDDTDNMVSSVAWHPDGDKLALALTEVIEIINASTGVILHKINNTYSDNSVAWSSDGQKFAYKSSKYIVAIFDFSNNSVVQSFRHDTSVNEVAWSPDSTKLATATHRFTGDVDYHSCNSVLIRNITNGTLLNQLKGSTSVHTVTWNSNGSMIAFGGGNEYRGKDGDNTIKIWNLSSINAIYTHEPNMTLAGHSGEVSSVRWSPDGRKLASGSADHTIRIWNVSTGSTITILGIEVPQETKAYPDELGGFYFLFFLLAIYGGGLAACVCGGMFMIRALKTRTRSRKYYPPRVPQKPIVPRKYESLSPITKHYCPYCGEKAIAGKFCTKCGAELK